jgi:hypothetical protein
LLRDRESRGEKKPPLQLRALVMQQQATTAASTTGAQVPEGRSSECHAWRQAASVGLGCLLDDAPCSVLIQKVMAELAKSDNIAPSIERYKACIRNFVDAIHC